MYFILLKHVHIINIINKNIQQTGCTLSIAKILISKVLEFQDKLSNIFWFKAAFTLMPLCSQALFNVVAMYLYYRKSKFFYEG